MAQRALTTSAGGLAASLDPGRVWRVGHRPGPWAWTPWQYAGETGRFPGRWDDPRGSFRTVYAGCELLACLLEILAPFRPDPLLEEDLAGIDEEHADGAEYPSRRPGVVPATWLEAREASAATLSGVYCAVADKESLPTLRARFLPSALRYGLADLDAGALRLSAPRLLTQEIAAWLYDLHDGSQDLFAGAQFESRHGDGLTLWAVFERDDDLAVSARLTAVHDFPLTANHPDRRRRVRSRAGSDGGRRGGGRRRRGDGRRRPSQANRLAGLHGARGPGPGPRAPGAYVPSVRVQDQASLPADTCSSQDRAVDEFLAATDADSGPVPEEVLAEVRAAWPE
ncbi:MAG: RES family NAD+ phosphorylase [Acidimicrobiales bacterium]